MPRLLAVVGLPWCTSAAFGALRPTTEVQEQDQEVPKPIMASRFHVTFKEYTHGLKPWGDGTYNVGSLHYDVGSDVARTVWSHGKGQTDNWCQCAGISTAEECDLLALPETKTTVALFKTLSPELESGFWAASSRLVAAQQRDTSIHLQSRQPHML